MDEILKANYPVEGSSSSSSSSSSDDSRKESASLTEILNKRLQVLEQDSEKMKKDFVVCMDERREIIHEILQLFQTPCSETKHPLGFYQEIRHHNIGLLQALCEHSNPFLVTQGSSKSNIFC